MLIRAFHHSQAAQNERARELERVWQTRRGHQPQISISDDSHHVTEAIGDMYGDEEDFSSNSKRSFRPLSFMPAPHGDRVDTANNPFLNRASPQRAPLSRTGSNERVPVAVNGAPKMPPRSPSYGQENGPSPMSPPHLHRTPSETATQQFPLNDIDYESSPAAVAQELSNLQAIRRMSMDINSDPDLPSFNSGITMPTMAPSHSGDEDDPGRLFWVPARLHPELAPTEFKTFIEDKVDKLKRRSGGEDGLAPDGLGRTGSEGGLRRKKSTLSKQIDSSGDFEDGADTLQRKRSQHGIEPNGIHTNLQQLEDIVSDPASLMRRLSVDSGSSMEGPAGEDRAILPVKGAGGMLKRSTRTTYRRGSLRKAGPSRRRPGGAETDGEDSPVSSPIAGVPELPNFQGLSRVQTEPMPPRPDPPENFSRPTRKRSPPLVQQRTSGDAPRHADQQPPIPPMPSDIDQRSSLQPRPFHSRIASHGRTTAQLPGYNAPVPQIIETPPPDSRSKGPMSNIQLPERRSSHDPPPFSQQPQVPAPRGPPPQIRAPGPPARPLIQKATSNTKQPNQTLDDMASHPSPLPGHASRTDSLSFIPTLEEPNKRVEKKKSKEKDLGDGSKKSGWNNWFSSSDDKEKEKEKEKERERERREREEAAKKPKSKLTKPAGTGDNTRLDVLQTSIEGNRPRESLVLDRESLKLEEERKKESNRKASGGDKKEKDGLFSSLFSSKKKGDKETVSKKDRNSRGLSPEPPPRILKPDIDYNWTRFSILEERAIYRMAHLKLANPRRELYSQVLLSNFMYSYLAKVQQMHPQVQIGQTPQQKLQQRTQQQQQQQQLAKKTDLPVDEVQQYQRFQEVCPSSVLILDTFWTRLTSYLVAIAR